MGEGWGSRISAARRVFGPVLALGSGMVSVALLRRGLAFAPVAVATLLLAWSLLSLLGRKRTPEAPGPEAAPEGRRPRWRSLANGLTRYLITAIYQDVLFFLLPVWFGSATWPSLNIGLPLVLAALAVFSCFDRHYERMVLAHPILSAAVTALILFATLIAALPVLLPTGLRTNLGLAAGAGALLAGARWLELRTRRGLATLAAMIVLAPLGAVLLARVLPPVPVQCLGHAVAETIADREPVGERREFAAGTAQVWVWFAVAAPTRFSDAVRFRWYHDGVPAGRDFETSIAGGRKTGFRTWGRVSTPGPGTWQVELISRAGQLIARESFVVVPAPVP